MKHDKSCLSGFPFLSCQFSNQWVLFFLKVRLKRFLCVLSFCLSQLKRNSTFGQANFKRNKSSGGHLALSNFAVSGGLHFFVEKVTSWFSLGVKPRGVNVARPHLSTWSGTLCGLSSNYGAKFDADWGDKVTHLKMVRMKLKETPRISQVPGPIRASLAII